MRQRVLRVVKRGALSLLCFGGVASCMAFFPVPGTGKGCRGESASYYPSVDVVRLQAARDLSCPADQIRVDPSGSTTYHALGCGRSEQYTCEDDEVSGCNLEDAAERDGCVRDSDS